MVVIKNDERTGRFRDRSSNIKAYTRVNHIPKVRLDVIYVISICIMPAAPWERASAYCLIV